MHLPFSASRSASADVVPIGLEESATGAASFITKSRNRKLSPVLLEPTSGRPRPVARPPFVSATYASIEATCLDACPFKKNGCYVRAGATRLLSNRLDAAAKGRSASEVVAYEALLIGKAFRKGVPQDGARGGRDLRLHVGGDVGSEQGAQVLAGAARRWRARGGGTVWTFTHQWREVPREAWGNEISVLGSVERPEDIAVARAAGYAAAIVVDHFPSRKPFRLPGSTARIIPCPAETTRKTCVKCRLCLDADLLKMNVAIAFAAHGPSAKRARNSLVQLRLPKGRVGRSGGNRADQ